MKKLLYLIFLGLFVFLNAQGITHTLGTADATSSFDVHDMNALPLSRTQANGWTGFLDAIPPEYPHHLSTSYYNDAGSLYYQPAALFVNTVVSRDGVGVAGYCNNTDWWGVGVYGEGLWQGVRGVVKSAGTDNDQDYNGVYGFAQSVGGLTRGVKGYGYEGHTVYGGYFYGGYGSHQSWGAYGEGEGAPTNYGLYGWGHNAAPTGWNVGVYGGASSATATNYGVYGWADGATTNWAGYFSGNVNVTGDLTTSTATYKIDHPLDPENQYLSHSSVESSDMMNIYNGNSELNYAGEAEIELPDWFNALNSDFRYQLTAIGAPGPNLYVSEEVNGNTFRVAGGEPGMKVSWQITGIRNDAHAKANPIKVEEYKATSDIGKYLHPEVHGMPQSKQINYEMISQEKEMVEDEKMKRVMK